MCRFDKQPFRLQFSKLLLKWHFIMLTQKTFVIITMPHIRKLLFEIILFCKIFDVLFFMDSISSLYASHTLRMSKRNQLPVCTIQENSGLFILVFLFERPTGNSEYCYLIKIYYVCLKYCWACPWPIDEWKISAYHLHSAPLIKKSSYMTIFCPCRRKNNLVFF